MPIPVAGPIKQQWYYGARTFESQVRNVGGASIDDLRRYPATILCSTVHVQPLA